MKYIYGLLLLTLSSNVYSQYDINGDAFQTSCNCYTLTNAINTQAGSVWNINQIDLNDSFDFTFDVFLGNSDGGADGMVFGLQPINTSVGSNGGGMGFQGVTPSVGVYIDTYQNGINSDPWDDHISINKNGDIDHNSLNNVAGPNTLTNVENGVYHKLRVVWDAPTTTMSVYFDDVFQFDRIEDFIVTTFGGNPNVYWGFTAATGGLNNEHKFCTQLEADFAFTGGKICPGTEIDFADNSESFGGIASWEWDIDNDGVFDYTGQSASHTFTQVGIYPVTLKIVDDNTCEHEKTVNIEVAVPDIDITASSVEVCEGDQIDLTSVSAQNFFECFYTFELIDSFGDGWNGNSLDIYIDGVLEGNYTFTTGSNFQVVVDVYGATDVSVDFNGTGSFTYECELKIYNNLGTLVFDDQDIDVLANPIHEEDITTCPEYTVSYDWSSDSQSSFSTEENTTYTIDATENLTFSVTLAGAQNCTNTESILITANEYPELLGDTVYSCFENGDEVDLNTVIIDANQNTQSINDYFFWEDNTFLNELSSSVVGDIGTYYVTKANNGCLSSAELTLENLCEPKIELPNVFTPNGTGGQNDLFKPNLFEFVGDHLFTVYNRWGQVVYETNNLPGGWDGEGSNGKKLSSSTYYYVLKYQDEAGVEFEPITGNISIF